MLDFQEGMPVRRTPFCLTDKRGRRQVRVHVPHESEDERLRFHELWAQVKRYEQTVLVVLVLLSELLPQQHLACCAQADESMPTERICRSMIL
jgi:hypothetical protein